MFFFLCSAHVLDIRTEPVFGRGAVPTASAIPKASVKQTLPTKEQRRELFRADEDTPNETSKNRRKKKQRQAKEGQLCLSQCAMCVCVPARARVCVLKIFKGCIYAHKQTNKHSPNIAHKFSATFTNVLTFTPANGNVCPSSLPRTKHTISH